MNALSHCPTVARNDSLPHASRDRVVAQAPTMHI